MSAYTASKAALAGWADAVRGELAADGVHVAQVQPGVIATDFLERAQWRGPTAEADAKSMQEMLSSGGAMVQTPEQVAAAVVRAVDRGQREVMVGWPFKAINAVYNWTGVNVMAR